MSQWISTVEECLKEEAQALVNLIPLLDKNIDKAVALILEAKGKLIVTGVGKSGHVGKKMAATFASTGTPSFYLNPLDMFHGDLGAIAEGDVVLAISNSGQTDELLRIIPNLMQRRIPIIGMSGNPDSLLARYSDAHININVDHEATPSGLAPTSSTTATLAMGDAMACCLIKARQFGKTDFAQFHPGGTLGRRLLTKASDVMVKEGLPVVSEATPLGQALITMSQGRLGICVALDDDERVTGIVTDGDLRRAMERKEKGFFDLTVGDIMTRSPQTVGVNEPIEKIENLMNARKIHCVLVVNKERRLLGVVDSFGVAI